MNDITQAIVQEQAERRAEVREEIANTFEVFEEFLDAKIRYMMSPSSLNSMDLVDVRTKFIDHITDKLESS